MGSPCSRQTLMYEYLIFDVQFQSNKATRASRASCHDPIFRKELLYSDYSTSSRQTSFFQAMRGTCNVQFLVEINKGKSDARARLTPGYSQDPHHSNDGWIDRNLTAFYLFEYDANYGKNDDKDVQLIPSTKKAFFFCNYVGEGARAAEKMRNDGHEKKKCFIMMS